MSEEKLSLEEARIELAAGRAVNWDNVDHGDVDNNRPKEVQDAMDRHGLSTEAGLQSMGRNIELDSGNADHESQASGEYETAAEAVEDLREEADLNANPADGDVTTDDDRQVLAEKVADELEGLGTTEAELQDAEHKGLVNEDETNPRNDAQKALLEQEIENEDGNDENDVTDAGLRKQGEDEDSDDGDTEAAAEQAAREDIGAGEGEGPADTTEAEEANAGDQVVGGAEEAARAEEARAAGGTGADAGVEEQVTAEANEDEDEASEDTSAQEPENPANGLNVADFKAKVGGLTDEELTAALADDRKGVTEAAQAELDGRKA